MYLNFCPISYNQAVMDNNRAQVLDGAEETIENPSRRDFLAQAGGAITGAVVATAGLAQQALADEVTQVAEVVSEDDFSDIPYRESELGIDYHALADFPVDHMLSQGEAEWMENASDPDEYGEDAAEAWGHEMAPYIGEGRVSEFMIDEMKSYTPNMLLSFARLPVNHPKYGLIEAYGREFQLDQYIQKQDKIALNDT